MKDKCHAFSNKSLGEEKKEVKCAKLKKLGQKQPCVTSEGFETFDLETI